ncbi:hypothetical protein EW145_g1240 [Phellinidium pouzarii]|uniref:Protein ZIP4 homolog n=1 Tax=Phellinidium pouzarii TaxID=167371 RepID=A0A4S4LFI1_9AGAM|nr:hypothetical protein EW145_g1240 [Phellinidium pouzarii]
MSRRVASFALNRQYRTRRDAPMSTHKRKNGDPAKPQLKDTFDAIVGIIARVKPKLADLGRKDGRRSLLDDLQHLVALGETLTEQRQRSKLAIELADTLDREALFVKDQKATKIEVSLQRFEEQLRNTEDANNSAYDQAMARATVLYYSSRMLTAWRDGNDAIAQFMLEKITGTACQTTLFWKLYLYGISYSESDEKRLSLITVPDRELLAARMLEIGKSILKASSRGSGDGAAALADSRRAQDAVRWIQKAFTLVEKMEDTETPGMAELKRGILRSLARAYYLSSSIEAENLARAETTLQELIASIDNAADNTNPEHNQLRWMRLSVLKKRKAPDPVMEGAFASIIDHTIFTESEVTDILQELRTLSQEQKVVSNVLRRCIIRLLDGPAENAMFIDRILLSLISHCAKDQDHSRAIMDIEAGCSLLTESEFELEKTPAMACLVVLWKVGDRCYEMKKWAQAAEWFLAGTHKAFASIAQMSCPKCFRKAALCYIEQGEYARASQVIHHCPKGQSSTFYLLFLSAVHQGLEEDAVSAIQDMAVAPDFDRKMLLLATQLAHESDIKSVLLASLEALLKTVQSHGPTDSDIEAVLLARCIIRLVIRLMKDAPTEKDRMLLVSNLIRHCKTASTLVQSAVAGKNAPFIAKDVSWLWRIVYNTAVQGCSDWQHAESQIADLFEIAFELVHAYSRIAVANTEVDVFIHMAFSAFSCVSARMFVLRHSLQSGDDKIDQQAVVLRNMQRVKETISYVKEHRSSDLSDRETFDDLLHAVQVFEAEVYCQRQEWDKLIGAINEIGGASLSSYEAIADMLWSENTCPVNVLYIALEALLHACLDRGTLSVEKFSRWLRAICTILLSRNTPTDRAKAISYVEQALVVLEDQSSDESEGVYPIDERQWLLSTSYNTGIECLAASYLDEAKRWFEAATIICRSVPDGARHSERISDTYRRLLDQYVPLAT